MPEFIVSVIVVFAAGTGVALTLGATTANEFLWARGCYIIAAVALSVAYFYWLYEAPRGPLRLIIGSIVGVLIIAGTPELLRWVNSREVALRPAAVSAQTSQGSQNPMVVSAQFAKIRELEAFIGQGENDLRLEFDYYAILSKNIGIQNIRIGMRNAGKLNDFRYVNYTEGSDANMIMLATEGKYHFIPSGPVIDEGPHDVLFLVTTSKYSAAQKTIIGFIDSALIPTAIKQKLIEFKKGVDENFEKMIRLLDVRMNERDDFFLKNRDPKSPYYLVINNDFVTRFDPLKPKADGVLLEIAKYWKTN